MIHNSSDQVYQDPITKALFTVKGSAEDGKIVLGGGVGHYSSAITSLSRYTVSKEYFNAFVPITEKSKGLVNNGGTVLVKGWDCVSNDWIAKALRSSSKIKSYDDDEIAKTEFERNCEEYPIPDYEDSLPTREDIEYARSIVGKFALSKWNHRFVKVIKQNDDKRGGDTSQVWVRIYSADDMWTFIKHSSIFPGAYLELYKASNLSGTDRQPTFKETVCMIVRSILIVPIRFVQDARKDIDLHNHYRWTPFKHTNIIANLYGAIHDVYYWMRHGYEIHSNEVRF